MGLNLIGDSLLNVRVDVVNRFCEKMRKPSRNYGHAYRRECRPDFDLISPLDCFELLLFGNDFLINVGVIIQAEECLDGHALRNFKLNRRRLGADL
jgi:hypothetical protein